MRKLSKKQKIISGLTALVFLISGGFFFVNQKNSPPSISSELIPIGTDNTGCEWWQVPFYFGFCKGPSYSYFYESDLTLEDLKGHFSKATFQGEMIALSADYEYLILSFQSARGQDFAVSYYESKLQLVARRFGGRAISHRSIISIDQASVSAVKASLE